MKKLGFLLSTFLLSLTSVLTSCFSNDIPEIVINGSTGSTTDQEVKINDDDIHPSDDYSYTIVSNVSAEIYVDGVKKAQGVSFVGYAVKGATIVITASVSPSLKSTYYSGTITKTVTLDAPSKVVQLNFPKNSTTGNLTATDYPYSISLGDAINWLTYGNSDRRIKAGDTLVIKNTSANVTEPYGSNGRTYAEMRIYSSMLNTAKNNGLSEDSIFTITATNVPIFGINENLNNCEEWFSVVRLTCTPDGARFGSYPALVTVKNKYFEKDMSFRCQGASNGLTLDPDGGSVSMEFSHFSDYDVEANAKVVLQDESDIVVTQSYFDCRVGTYDYNYMVYSGYTCDYSGKNGFIDKYLIAKFGTKKTIKARTVSITNMTARASVPYTSYQKLKRYFVWFGDLKVEVYVYGEDWLEIDNGNAVPWTEVRHSGMSAE